MPYKLKGNCVVKADTGEEVKCHATPAEAEAHMKALMENVADADKYAGARHSASDIADIQTLHDISVRQGAMCPANGGMGGDGKDKMKANIDCYIIENFVATKPGDPYLWLPYGTIRKGDNVREVTRELASQFKLPHFKPPIKLGSHDDTTPAGGHILRHELRDDGIWVWPELVPSGEKTLAEGAFRYHSPEIIWPDGYLQNPDTGEYMPGPFIMGDAWLHAPHLGEKTALYSIERNNTMAETVTLPQSLMDKFLAMFERQTNPPGETPEVTKLKAEASEAAKYKAELDTLKAEAAKAEQLTALIAELQSKESYGAYFADAKVARTAAEHFSAMPQASREWAQKEIRALIAQVSTADLHKKFGTVTQGANGGTPAEMFDAEIRKVMTEKKLTYPDAAKAVAAEKPDLYQAYKNPKD